MSRKKRAETQAAKRIKQELAPHGPITVESSEEEDYHAAVPPHLAHRVPPQSVAQASGTSAAKPEPAAPTSQAGGAASPAPSDPLRASVTPAERPPPASAPLEAWIEVERNRHRIRVRYGRPSLHSVSVAFLDGDTASFTEAMEQAEQIRQKWATHGWKP